MLSCLVDGAPSESVAVADRGLHYGDGLFETLAVADGAPELWDRHMARLGLGCGRLGMPAPDTGLLRAEAERICVGAERAVLKLVLTRGIGGRGYRPPRHCRPTRILGLYPWPEYPAAWWREGISVRVCRHRLPTNPVLAGLKHLNRLDQVLARGEWSDAVIAEGLMLDQRERVVEGTMSNLFLVRSGRLATPTLSECGVAGVMRGLVMDTAAALGIPCDTVTATLPDVLAAGEAFLCNSVVGIWPVRSLEGRMYPAPGPVTLRLSEAIAEVRRS